MIRPARLEDAAALARLQVAVWHRTYPGLVPQPMLEAMAVPRRIARWQETLSDPTGPARTWVADRDGVAGFVSAGPARDAVLRGQGAEGEIWAIYVDVAAQGRGLGAALMRHAAGRLAEQGHHTMGLWAVTGNLGAAAFYRRLGGQPGLRQNAPVEGGKLDETAWLWHDLRELRCTTEQKEYRDDPA